MMDHSDRLLIAEEAIEPEFDRLARAAERSGLSKDEAASTLLNLAVARVLALRANVRTETAIAAAVAAVHGIEVTP